MSRQIGYDRHITIFSPEGRLYQIEYALSAVKNTGLSTIGLCGEDSVVFVTQKKVQEKLLDPASVTSMFNITPDIGCVITGMAGDGRALVSRARQISSKFEAENAYEIPAHVLSLKVANIAQVYTQHAYMRPYGVMAFFCSMDDEKGPQLFKCEPTGFYMGFKACAAGPKEEDACNALEKIIKKTESKPLKEKDNIEEAINCLQTVLGLDFKAIDCEVAVVSKSRPQFTRLTVEEIDMHLNNIAERD
eukprot:GEMP01060512.1.p1 GENE.GEMP01060512.1~~GEMP01060512.1.p1  ORF type:complete len:247 (+),score=48.30 GEMP01060512.1:150-890(+)